MSVKSQIQACSVYKMEAEWASFCFFLWYQFEAGEQYLQRGTGTLVSPLFLHVFLSSDKTPLDRMIRGFQCAFIFYFFSQMLLAEKQNSPSSHHCGNSLHFYVSSLILSICHSFSQFHTQTIEKKQLFSLESQDVTENNSVRLRVEWFYTKCVSDTEAMWTWACFCSLWNN